MKAVRIHEFGGPEVLKYEEVPDPVVGPGEVILRTYAVGVNPYETYQRAGKYGPLKFPNVLGADAAGEILAVGDGVANLAVGDRVYTAGTISGAYAEQILAAASTVFPLPPNVLAAKGATLAVPYGTAYHALVQRAQARAGETVLIHGASGGVGIAAVQFALSQGLKVIGTAGTPEGITLVEEQGAHLVLNHKEEGYGDQIKKFTEGEGVDLILEMLANINLASDLTLLGKRGRVVVIGSRGPVEIDPREIMGRSASILGISLSNATPEEMRSIHAAIYAGLRNDSLRPIIGSEIPLAEAARAHAAIMENSAYGKIVLIP
ncbi:MAG: NADPH:quinone reductase [Cytophagales bacterium]|nr:NADPH:quinone reductase [Armatimonadota bacterium]